MPDPLHYATRDFNRRDRRSDVPMILLSSVQLLSALAVLKLGRPTLPVFSKYWYEWPGELWLSDTCMGVFYLAGVLPLVIGATKMGIMRTRWYQIYLLIWIVNIAVIEIALMTLSPWPGERTYRWILRHNLHSGFVDPEQYFNIPLTYLVLSPAIFLMPGRFVFERVQTWRSCRSGKVN